MARHLAIDRDACAGHGLCYSEAPDVLDSDDQGDPVILEDPVPEDQVDAAERVVQMCPEQALALTSD
jgi:ferredoxin